MRRLVVLATFALVAAPGVGAQQRWQTEVGVQGGFTRWAPAGMGKGFRIDLIDLPGVGGFGRTAVYAILPVRERIAIEPSFLVSQGSYGEGFTRAIIGLRGDYAFTSKIYAAGGGVLDYADDQNVHATKVGAQFGVGDRMRFVQYGSYALLTFPGWGSSNVTTMEYIPGLPFVTLLTPPTLFAVVPLGSRFGNDLGGRVEASYMMMKQTHVLQAPQANNITNITFAMTAPLR